MEWLLQIVDDFDDAIAALGLIAVGLAADIGLQWPDSRAAIASRTPPVREDRVG
jgi:hypothetical protein